MPTLGRLSAGLALVLAACGDETIASRFLARAQIGPTGGALSVSAADGAGVWTGAALDVPAGALETTATITIEPGAEVTLAADETVAGPALDFGPDGLQFEPAATMTLPLSSTPASDEEIRIYAVDADGSVEIIEGEAVVYDETTGQVSFPVSHFTTFQPGRRRRPPPTGCMSDADCGQGEWCVQSMCIAPRPGQCRGQADCSATEICQNGTCTPASTGCTSDADCSRGEWCVNASCVTPRPGQCRTNADCAAGETCQQNACVMTPVVGCITANAQQLSFSTTVNGVATRTVTVAARSAATLSSISTSGSTDFAASTRATLPTRLAAGQTLTVEVAYSPSASGRASGTLSLDPGTLACPVIDISLSGTASGMSCQSDRDCAPGQRCLQGICT
ncbi:MAG: hypothetical protein AAFZ18_35160 [Myxococcota bacterium]